MPAGINFSTSFEFLPANAVLKPVAFTPSPAIPASNTFTFGNCNALLKRSTSPLPAAKIKLVSGLSLTTL
jgi:hypothetical protein